MREAAEFEAKLLVDKLDQVRQDIGEVEKRIKEIGEGFTEYRYLLTVPGGGTSETWGHRAERAWLNCLLAGTCEVQ